MNFNKEINLVEKNIQKDIKYAEKWVYERRKFLIKLCWVIGGVALLLIISNLYLTVNGVGV